MSHLALYRKWRPQTFDALIGQEDIGRTLKNAILHDRLVHAYLFCGTRGTGKTSTARILAKAVNCLDPQAGEPCNRCASCCSIVEGRSLDVIEIDAASNRGIDEVRDLLEKVHFVPVESRYKVYIVDEAHMLTNEAFNALLKTFEEPPSHVLFILATTEARKVPLTIVSRCQRFDFKPIDEAAIVASLAAIAAAEGAEAEDDALALIAHKAKGSMRDALSLFDQMMAEGKVGAKEAVALLGTVERTFWPPFLQALAARDAKTVFAAIDGLEREGKDLRVFLQDMQTLLGDLLVYGAAEAAFTASYCGFLKETAGILRDGDILRIIAVSGEGESAFRYRRDSKTVLQFLFAKILRDGTEASAGPRPQKRDKAPPRETRSAVAKEEIPPWETPAPPVEPPPREAPAAVRSAPEEAEEIDEVWSRLMKEIKSRSPKTAAWLLPARLAAIGQDRVTIAYGPDGEMHRERIGGSAHMEALTEALSLILGRKIAVRIEGQAKAGEKREEPNLFSF